MSKASRHIIIPDQPGRFGKTRSEQAENLEREGWGTGLTDVQRDKLRYLERKLGTDALFPKQQDIDRVR